MKQFISSLLIIILAFSPGGFAMEMRYDCSMTGQRNLASCCCCCEEIALGTNPCGEPLNTDDRESDEPSFANTPCCQAHLEVVSDFDPALLIISPVDPVPPAIPAPSMVGAPPAPHLTVCRGRFQSGAPPGTAATVPMSVRYCCFLI